MTLHMAAKGFALCVCLRNMHILQVNDSSFMVSVVRTAMLLDGDINKSLEMYPELPEEAESERANKYNIMYGNTEDIDSRR